MIALPTLIIAAVITLALLLLTLFAPNPFTLIGTLIVGGVLVFVMWPKYQTQRQAMHQGQVIQAAVQEVREWSRKQGDGNMRDFYEIVAVAPHPDNGQIVTFVSPPMSENPKPYIGNSVRITVDWSNPKAYVMDLSFLPFKVN